MEQRRQAGFERDLLVDGLIIIATDSQVFGTKVFLTIYKNFFVETIEPSLLRGLRHFAKKTSFAIYLSPDTRPRIALFVTPETGDFIRGISGVVKEAFAKAVDFAMSLLPSNGPTRTAFTAHNSCHNFFDVSCNVNTFCDSCSRGRVEIHPKEVQRFGQILIEKVRMDLQERGVNCACNFAMYEFGQSVLYNDYVETISRFRMEYAADVVLHVARDYSKQNTCALWDVNKILEQHIIAGERALFFPMMTLGHGNITFDQTKRQNYGAVYDSGMHYASIKFYTDSFKTMHRTGDRTTDVIKWKKPIVENALTEIAISYGPGETEGHRDTTNATEQVFRESKYVRQPKTVLGWIATVEKLRDLLDLGDRNVARYEAIIVLPDNALRIQNHGRIWEVFLEFFEAILGTPGCEVDWINTFEYAAFRNQISNTLMVATGTLKRIIVTAIAERAQGNRLTSIPDTVTLQTAIVCEQIISFCIYGKLGYSHRDKRGGYFCTALRKALNLLPTTYKTRPVDGDPFKGLTLCGKKLKLNDKELKWEGELFVGPNIWSCIEKDTSKENCKTLHKILKKIHENRANPGTDVSNDDYGRICEILWESISFHSRVSNNGFGDDVYDVKSFKDSLNLWHSQRSAIDFTTSQSLAEKIFLHPEELDQIGLAHYIRDLREQLGPLRSMNLIKKLGDFVEEQLQRSQSLGILYPVKMGRNMKLLAVLAFQGTQEENFVHSSPESFYDVDLKQKNMTLLYTFAYEFFMSAKCDEDIMNYVLSVTLGKTPVNLGSRFGRFNYGITDIFSCLDYML